MSGDLSGNPTPWPAPPAPGEQRLRSTTASPMQSPKLNAAGGGTTLQDALQQTQQPSSSSSSSSLPPPVAAAAPPAAAFSASSQQTLLRGGSSSPSAAAAGVGGAENGTAEVTSSPERRFVGGVVGLSRERSHHLRVRKRIPLSSNLTAELGVSTELLSGEVARHAALTYEVILMKKEGLGEERERGETPLTRNEKTRPPPKKNNNN